MLKGISGRGGGGGVAISIPHSTYMTLQVIVLLVEVLTMM